MRCAEALHFTQGAKAGKGWLLNGEEIQTDTGRWQGSVDRERTCKNEG